MSSATTTAAAAESAPAPAKPGASTKKKLLLLGTPVAVALLLAGLWFGGILPGLLGMAPKPVAVDAAAGGPTMPVFVELPEMVANLNAGERRQAYVKLRARVELARAADQPTVQAAMPRLQDLFQTYLREMRPEELRGSAGIWRLREELIARGNAAVAPARITNVLFTELLIQ